jgi:antitoxin HigA-1
MCFLLSKPQVKAGKRGLNKRFGIHWGFNMPRDYPIPHPGELLREEFLIPMGITVYALAKAIHVPRSRINEICRGNQGITASIAVRLGKFFGTDPQWFLNMQSQYDLENACLDLADKLDAIEPYQTAA